MTASTFSQHDVAECSTMEHDSPRSPHDVVIVGAGAAGLGAAYAMRQAGRVARTVVLEGSARTGGLVETERTSDGFLLEQGPDSLVRAKPTAARLAGELHVDVLDSGPAPRRAFVLSAGALHPLPDGIGTFSPRAIASLATTSLLSPRGKARLAIEPLVRPAGSSDDESVGAFFTRRFGPELSEKIVEPMLRGMYGSTADQLSVRAIFPALAAAETRHGSLTAAFARAANPSPSPSGPAVYSLTHGMDSLTRALAAAVSNDVVCGVHVRRARRNATRGFVVDLANGATVHGDALVVATPAWVAAELLADVDVDLAHELAGIGRTDLRAATFAFRRNEVPHELGGTGFVVTAREGRATMACTWSSRKWHGRAPEGFETFRCFLSDVGDDPREVAEHALRDLREVLGIEAAPSRSWIRVRHGVLPVYGLNHAARLERIRLRVQAIDGLALAGNAYGGVGVSDCLASGAAAATSIGAA